MFLKKKKNVLCQFFRTQKLLFQTFVDNSKRKNYIFT